MTKSSASGPTTANLQRSLRRTQFALAGTVLVLVASVVWQFFRRPVVFDEVRTHRLVLLDDHDVKRVEMGQDATSWRRSRSAGMWVFDSTGHERGGISTFEDGSVAMALDAPHGVGEQPADRLGLRVDRNGATTVLLTGNDTGGVVRLVSDGCELSHQLGLSQKILGNINASGATSRISEKL